MNRVLDGIRIIDFTRVYAGTTCTDDPAGGCFLVEKGYGVWS